MLDEGARASADLADLSSGPRFRGGLDGLRDGKLSGWVVDLRRPAASLEVTLTAEGILLKTLATAIARRDLPPSLAPNVAGFQFDFTRLDPVATAAAAAKLESLGEEELAAPADLRVAVAGGPEIDATELGMTRRALRDSLVPRHKLDAQAPAISSLETLASGPRFRGGIDQLKDGCLSGWAIDLADPQTETPFELIAEGVVLGRAATSLRRFDLEPYVAGNRAGFVIDLWQWGEEGPRKVIAFLENLPQEVLESPCSVLVGLGEEGSCFDVGRFGVSRASLLTQLECAAPSLRSIPAAPTQTEPAVAAPAVAAPAPQPSIEPGAEPEGAAFAAEESERADWLQASLETSRAQTAAVLQCLASGIPGFAEYAAQVANDPRRLCAFALDAGVAGSARASEAAKAHAHAIRDLFDPLLYLETWQASAECDNPLLHYVTEGWKQRRPANLLFDAAYYLEQAGQVDGDPLLHFVEHGARAGLDPHPLFSTRFYAGQYLKEQDTNPLLHYQLHGGAMRLDPSPLFDTMYFLAALPFAETVGCPLEAFVAQRDTLLLTTHAAFDALLYRYQLEVERGQTLHEPAILHYLKSGYRDRTLLPNLLFDPQFYRERNRLDHPGPDLVHYLTQGDRLGLACHPLFSPRFYNEQRGADATSITALEHALLFPEAGLRSDPRAEKPLDRRIFDFVRQLADGEGDFSPAFYRAANPDLAGADDAYLEMHFSMHGRKEGRVASPRALLQRLGLKLRDLPVGMFADEYIELNPDLAVLAGKPLTCLVHYLEHGRRENRMYGFWQLHLDDFVLNLPTRSAPRRSASAKARTQVCVLVHAFYPELLPELLGFAQNFSEVTSDIFVNVVDLSWNTKLHRELRELGRGAYVQLSNDNGRDIGGFTRLLDNIDLERYELFAFMHSKKSPHVHERRAEHWRRTLLKAFAGSPEIAKECVSLFASQKVGMIAAKEWRSQHMGKNVEQYERMLDLLGIDAEHRELDYVSGTMFLIRAEIVKRLQAAIRTVDWEYGGENVLSFHMDGQIAHGAERAIPALVRQMGYEIVWR